MIVTGVSVSPYVPWSVDFVGCVLMLSQTSDFYNTFSDPLMRFPELSLIFVCGFLHLVPSVAGKKITLVIIGLGTDR